MAAEDRSEDGPGSLPDFGDAIDPLTFEQILEMDDDDEDHDFSKGIVDQFFEQAQRTFTEMDAELANGNLAELSAKGHFLKGSSATIGLTKVKDSCEKIQHFGNRKGEDGGPLAGDANFFLNLIRTTLVTVKSEYAEAERILKRFYHEA